MVVVTSVKLLKVAVPNNNGYKYKNWIIWAKPVSLLVSVLVRQIFWLIMIKECCLLLSSTSSFFCICQMVGCVSLLVDSMKMCCISFIVNATMTCFIVKLSEHFFEMELYERKECVSIRKVATVRYTIKVCILKEGLSVRIGKSEREKKVLTNHRK